MQLLIFEGIATSGKSTVIKKLVESLQGFSVVVADEEETHVPIMEQREDLHIDFFNNLVKRLVSNNPDLILIDRLYMTQAYRAKCSLDKYKELEEFLLKYNPITIFLKVDEKAISERIQKATEHRNPDWAEYIKSRGEEGNYADYYISQQRSQLELLQSSLVPFEIFNATTHEYESIIKELVNAIQSNYR